MYKYFAKDKNGEVIKGQIDAPSREYATSLLSLRLRTSKPASSKEIFEYFTTV